MPRLLVLSIQFAVELLVTKEDRTPIACQDTSDVARHREGISEIRVEERLCHPSYSASNGCASTGLCQWSSSLPLR